MLPIQALRIASLALVCFCIAGCATPASVSTTWKDPLVSAVSFRKVVVIVDNSTPGERRAQEDALVSQITQTSAVASYTFISDEMLKDVPAAKKQIIAGGFDGVVLVRLIDAQKQTTYYPPDYTDWNVVWGHNIYHQIRPGYEMTDTIIRAQLCLFAAPSGTLLWAGTSESLNPDNAREFATDLAIAAAKELHKQGIIH